MGDLEAAGNQKAYLIQQMSPATFKRNQTLKARWDFQVCAKLGNCHLMLVCVA